MSRKRPAQNTVHSDLAIIDENSVPTKERAYLELDPVFKPYKAIKQLSDFEAKLSKKQTEGSIRLSADTHIMRDEDESSDSVSDQSDLSVELDKSVNTPNLL